MNSDDRINRRLKILESDASLFIIGQRLPSSREIHFSYLFFFPPFSYESRVIESGGRNFAFNGRFGDLEDQRRN